jgi:cation diffusion facilitator family transporter
MSMPLGAATETLGGHIAHDEVAHRRDANRAVAVSAVGLALTGAVELVLAVVTGSVALLGDALHNLSDVSTSAVVFLGFRISRRPPNARYPYGYERAEDLAGLGVAVVIWVSAIVAGYESYRKLVDGSGTSRVGIGIAGAVLGIAGNQAVARYKAIVGRRIQSATLEADARHSWLDALSSLGALLGLVVVATGHAWGDPVAGFAVTLFIVRVGWEVTSDILHHLMDGIDEDVVGAAHAAATSVDGVHNATVLGRWSGRTLLLDVEGEVDAGITVAQADALGRDVEAAVHRAVPEARRVRFVATSAMPSAE